MPDRTTTAALREFEAAVDGIGWLWRMCAADLVVALHGKMRARDLVVDRDLPEEECDDGNPVDGDGCSTDCRKEFRYVFITNETFAADLGGSQGADEKCQIAASTAGLSGVFRAWLSTSTQQPLDVFVQSAVPYRRLDGMQVAENWPDLTGEQPRSRV